MYKQNKKKEHLEVSQSRFDKDIQVQASLSSLCNPLHVFLQHWRERFALFDRRGNPHI